MLADGHGAENGTLELKARQPGSGFQDSACESRDVLGKAPEEGDCIITPTPAGGRRYKEAVSTHQPAIAHSLFSEVRSGMHCWDGRSNVTDTAKA